MLLPIVVWCDLWILKDKNIWADVKIQIDSLAYSLEKNQHRAKIIYREVQK